MASRRSRLKAVANLPVRRKPLASQSSNEESKAEEEIPVVPSPNIEIKEFIDNQPDNASQIQKNESNLNDGASTQVESSKNDPVDIVPSDVAPAEVSNGKDQIGEKPVSNSCNAPGGGSARFGRRVKPSVSLAVLKERPQKTDLKVNPIENAKETSTEVSENFCDEKGVELSGVNKEASVVHDTIRKEETLSVNLDKTDFQINFTKKLSNQNKCPIESDKNTISSETEVNHDSTNTSSKSLITDTCKIQKGAPNLQHVAEKEVVEAQSSTTVPELLNTDFEHTMLSQIFTVEVKKTTTKKKKAKLNDCTQKVADARREFQKKYEKIPPDRSSLRMIDLIFYNPSTNPMESRKKTEKKDLNLTEQEIEDKVDDPDPVDKSSDLNPHDHDGNDEYGKMPVPQVKIGSNGEIILDEKSLVIETTEARRGREDLQNSVPIFEERCSKTCYYRRKTQKPRDWSDTETKRFYRALNTMGTDFSLMQKYFPIRSRMELKNKFKREEKLNRKLIDKALNNPSEFDITQFENYLAKQKKAEEELELILKRKARIKKSENRPRAKSSLLAKEVLSIDEDNGECRMPSRADQIQVRLKERMKKSKEANFLCDKFNSVDNREKIMNSPPIAISQSSNPPSKVFRGEGLCDLSSAAKLRDALDEIQNVNLNKGQLNRTLVYSENSKSGTDKSNAVGSNAANDFYEAVIGLASLTSTPCDQATADNSNPVKPVTEKRKATSQVSVRKVKKPTLPFISTLDIETYDSKGIEIDSSSNESAENSVTSTKTITDQDFIKLLAANVNNMNESKIQLQITEDCSSEKKLEIILDNVPSITFNEIQNQNVTVLAEYNTTIDETRMEEEMFPQKTSVIVRNPNAVPRDAVDEVPLMNSCEKDSENCSETVVEGVSEQNQNLMLVIDGVNRKNYEYMMLNEDAAEKIDSLENTPGEKFNRVEEVNVERLPDGPFLVLPSQSRELSNERKFSVFMISEKSKREDTSLLSSVPVILPPELIPTFMK